MKLLVVATRGGVFHFRTGVDPLSFHCSAAPRPPVLVAAFNEETAARQRQPGRHHSVRSSGVARERVASVRRIEVRAGTDSVHAAYPKRLVSTHDALMRRGSLVRS